MLDDATYNADADATRGTVSYASPILTCTGDLTPASRHHHLHGHRRQPRDRRLHPHQYRHLGRPRQQLRHRIHRPPLRHRGDGSAANHLLLPPMSAPPPRAAWCTTPPLLTNTGQTPYDGITMTADGSGLADDAVSNGDQTATSGSFSLGGTGAVWTGDVPVGGTVTLIGSVTVNNPDTGNHDPDRDQHLRRAGQQLPGRQHRPPLRYHHRRAHARPDHRHDGQRDRGGARPAGDLHRHRDRHRPDPLYRARSSPTPSRPDGRTTPSTTATPPPPPDR